MTGEGRETAQAAARGAIVAILAAALVYSGGLRLGRVQAALPCVGDCDGDGRVTVAELVKGVNIALGNSSLNECTAFDVTDDGRVTVDELIQGVNAALEGCVSDEATVARRAVATMAVTGTALDAWSDVFAVLIQVGANLGEPGGFVVPCPAGGQIAVDCTQSIAFPTVGPPTYTVSASSCRSTATGDTSVSLNGAMTLVGSEPGLLCFVAIPSTSTLAIPSFVAVAEDPSGSVTATLHGISGPLALSGSDPDCGYDTLRAQPNGSMVMVSLDRGGALLNATAAALMDPMITMAVEQFGASCASATIYRTTIDGSATFTTGGNTFAGMYEGYTLRDDRTSGTSMLTASGAIDSACFGTRVQFITHAGVLGAGGGCPRGGEIDAVHDVTTDRIRYTPEGSVEIDVGIDGSVDDIFDSCLNEQLFECPGK